MGMQHTSCLKDCSNNKNSDLEVRIIAKEINQQQKMTLTTENLTLKTTCKGTMQDYQESSPDNIDEQQSSNLENNPIPEFIKSKCMHSSVIPPRTNRFIMDMEVEVRAKIKEIQLQEYIEMNKILKNSKTLVSSQNLLGNVESSSNLLILNSSQLQIERHPSTQIECITAPVTNQKKQKGILKSPSSQGNVSSNDSKSKQNNIKRVHFSNETKFKTQDYQTFYRWRNFQNK